MSRWSDPLSLRARLREALPSEVYQLLQQAAAMAAAQDAALYLVGGPVRDLVLGRPITDLDLVIAGDAWPVAEAFAGVTEGRLTKHAAFRTAVVETLVAGQSYALDFVTARREVYPTPAALPEITPSHMYDDLARRDFTINALALALTAQQTDPLLDPFDGLGDITAQIIRVLHDRSFIDDPTRILRAARFAARLEFTVEPHTRALIDDALAQQMIARTSAQRILNELWLVLDEPHPEGALALIHQWAALHQLGLVWSPDWRQQFRAARTQPPSDPPARLLGFGLLIWPLAAQQRTAFAARYNLPTAERKLLQELPLTIPPALLQAALDANTLEQVLQPYSTAALHTLRLVAPPPVAAHIERYLDAIRSLPPLLTGEDLRAHGVAPGPRYREILAAARQAQLRGAIADHDAALEWLTQQDASTT